MQNEYPRVAAYIESLPHQLDSHPKALTRAAVFLHPVKGLGIKAPPVSFPRDLCALLTPPLLDEGEWIPTVKVNAMLLYIADSLHHRDVDFLAMTERFTLESLANPLTKAVITALSPWMLLKTAKIRWGTVHKGVMCSTQEIEKHRWQLRIDFPTNTYPELLIQSVNVSIQTLLRQSKSTALGKVETFSSTNAVFTFIW